MGILLPEESEPVATIQRSLKELQLRFQLETTALEMELAELTGKAATERNRKITDAELSYSASAEVKLVELYSQNYRQHVANIRKERDHKLAQVLSLDSCLSLALV